MCRINQYVADNFLTDLLVFAVCHSSSRNDLQGSARQQARKTRIAGSRRALHPDLLFRSTVRVEWAIRNRVHPFRNLRPSDSEQNQVLTQSDFPSDDSPGRGLSPALLVAGTCECAMVPGYRDHPMTSTGAT